MRKALLGILLLCGAVTGEEVPQGNPTISAGTFQGSASFVPWSGDWFNMKDGDLGIGWNGSKSYTVDPATKQYVFNPAVATKDLSPMAKYDKLVGNAPMSGAAKYELTVNETLEGDEWYHHIYGELKAKLDQEGTDYSWWGHCNGWAAAACLEAEPFASIEKSGIRFEVADLKGLLTESHFGVVSSYSGNRYNKPQASWTAEYNEAKSLLAALNSGNPPALSVYKTWYKKAYDTTSAPGTTYNWYKTRLQNFIAWYEEEFVQAYEDIRPDVFHKILLKVIGQQKSCVVFDISANEAVWNYPAFAFTTQVTDKGNASINGVTRRVFECTTTVKYADDGVSESILGSRFFTKTYQYELYATTNTKKLKGGKWLGSSVDDHPDFAWFAKYNPTDPYHYGNTDENVELKWSKILQVLPQKHQAKDGKPLQLFANGTGSVSRRSSTSPITWWNPVTTGSQITFSVQTTLQGVQTVKYFEQKVSEDSWNSVVKATRDPLVELGTGSSLTKTLPAGKHMVVVYAYHSSGKLLVMDEITVKVQ